MGQILRLQRLPPFPLRMTSCLDYRYIGFNYLQVLKNLRLWIWKLVASATKFILKEGLFYALRLRENNLVSMLWKKPSSATGYTVGKAVAHYLN